MYVKTDSYPTQGSGSAIEATKVMGMVLISVPDDYSLRNVENVERSSGYGDLVVTSLPRESAAIPLVRKRGKSPFFFWAWVISFCAVTLIVTYVMFVEPPPHGKIVIASGGKQGAYYRFAQTYAAELRQSGLDVEVRETAGSVENLQLLGQDDSGVSVAIVQSGVAMPEETDQFYALGSLYREPLWVFYRDEQPLGRISQLAGKRIGIGPAGSGTHAIATRLLDINGVSESTSEASSTQLEKRNVAEAATALLDGELDAAFFVAAIEADYIQKLLKDGRVKLLNFDQREAYCRRFRFLAPVTLPAGIVDLGQNVPDHDIALIAPTAMLVARKEFHPALIQLLLAAATHVHGHGDQLSAPGEFPSAAYCDFPISDDAKRYFTSGQPMLQRLLPFWVASLVDRAKVMLIPLIMLLMPLMRATPPLVRWQTRRRIYRWYSDLRDIDQKLIIGLSPAEYEVELARLNEIDHQVAFVDVPLSYMEEFYHLRMHLEMLRDRLVELRNSSPKKVE
jgi:uncharacterized protein